MKKLKQIQKIGCVDDSLVLDHLGRDTLKSVIWMGRSGIDYWVGRSGMDHLGCVVNSWRECRENVLKMWRIHSTTPLKGEKGVYVSSFVIL